MVWSSKRKPRESGAFSYSREWFYGVPAALGPQ